MSENVERPVFTLIKVLLINNPNVNALILPIDSIHNTIRTAMSNRRTTAQLTQRRKKDS